MLRSSSLDDGYFDRRNLRRVCTTRLPWGDFHPCATEILPQRLYLSDMYTATETHTLERLGITHVLTVFKGMWHFYPSNIKHTILPLSDISSENLFSNLDTHVAWINDALSQSPNSKVLVHCMIGMSRSASVVIAYLMALKRISVSEALAIVKAKRSIVRPNNGFLHQLVRYEQLLKQRDEWRKLNQLKLAKFH